MLHDDDAPITRIKVRYNVHNVYDIHDILSCSPKSVKYAWVITAREKQNYSYVVIDDLRKSRGLHSVSAYRHGLYIYI